MTSRREWITTGEAARILGVRSINTIKRLIRDGRLTAIRPGAHYRVAADDVRRLVEGRAAASRLKGGRLDPRSPEVLAWVAEWAERHHVALVKLFGSAARGEMRSDSDIDIAVEFKDGQHVGLFEMVSMRDELAERFGRPVDLGTVGSMRPHVHRHAAADLVTLYEV